MGVLQELKECILKGALNRTGAEESYDRKEAGTRKSAFMDLTKVDELKLFVCVNGLFRHLHTNKVLLEWSREVQNDFEAHRLLDLAEVEAPAQPGTHQTTDPFRATIPLMEGTIGLEKMVALVEEFRLLTEDGTDFGQNLLEQKLLLEKAIDILDLLCPTKPLETSSFLKWAESVFEMLQGLYSESDQAYLRERISSLKAKTESSAHNLHNTEVSGKK
jgi:hypothetical protein